MFAALILEHENGRDLIGNFELIKYLPIMKFLHKQTALV